MAEKRDYYEVLGVSKNATKDELKNTPPLRFAKSRVAQMGSTMTLLLSMFLS